MAKQRGATPSAGAAWSIGLALALFVVDQLTKQWVRDRFDLGESHTVIRGFFSLTYLRNTGAAWGLFGGRNFALIVLSLAVLTAMIAFRRHFLSASRIHYAAYGCMIGGILGNLADRIRLGWVTDFLDFQFGAYHWPSFNVADSAICIGVGLFIISSIRFPHRSLRTAPADGHD